MRDWLRRIFYCKIMDLHDWDSKPIVEDVIYTGEAAWAGECDWFACKRKCGNRRGAPGVPKLSQKLKLVR